MPLNVLMKLRFPGVTMGIDESGAHDRVGGVDDDGAVGRSACAKVRPHVDDFRALY
jgi:hypothetical protein